MILILGKIVLFWTQVVMVHQLIVDCHRSPVDAHEPIDGSSLILLSPFQPIH